MRLSFLAVAVLLMGPAQPVAAQPSLAGGYNGILGYYASGEWRFALRAGTTLTAGMTFTERYGLERVLALTQVWPVAQGWNLSLTLARGRFGGDYRVERLPEITLFQGARIGNTIFNYGVETGVGNYLVLPPNISGTRAHVAAQLTTIPIPLIPRVSLTAASGYRQHFYSGGELNAAWWETVQLSVAPIPLITATLTYFKQEATGASPLLFDSMGRDLYVAGTVSLNLTPATNIQHSQTYSYISQSITARIYAITFPLWRGQRAGLSWDDVPQKISLIYGHPRFGTLTVGWEIPTQRPSFSYSPP